MIFKQINVGNMGNLSYIIGDKNEAAIIDPGWEYEKLIETCKTNNLTIKKILLTHGQYDHAQDLKKIVEETKAKVYVHKSENIEGEFIENKDIITIGDLQIKVLHTPGHSPGSVCFLFDNKLITGDTLFVRGVGRVDLEGGNERELMESLKKLSTLDEKIEVFPGHDYGGKKSTIGKEKRENEFMKT